MFSCTFIFILFINILGNLSLSTVVPGLCSSLCTVGILQNIANKINTELLRQVFHSSLSLVKWTQAWTSLATLLTLDIQVRARCIPTIPFKFYPPASLLRHSESSVWEWERQKKNREQWLRKWQSKFYQKEDQIIFSLNSMRKK